MIKTTLLTKGVRYGVALFSTSECFEWQLMGHLQVLQCASTTMWKFFITLNWGWFQCIIHQCKIIVCHSIWQHCGDTFCWVLYCCNFAMRRHSWESPTLEVRALNLRWVRESRCLQLENCNKTQIEWKHRTIWECCIMSLFIEGWQWDCYSQVSEI